MARLKTIKPRLARVPARLARPATEQERLKARNATRPNWYSTARWQRLRRLALDRDNWVCRQTGALLIGTYPAPNSPTVDHIRPHRWDPELFWDLGNLQSVTKAWHDAEKQRIEARGDW
ncbi:HNH endonuclease [Jannaschia sp. M317]|uniref:HNH endonuclease n=1 Tax=Jannaschia sp. M317 TaxID=2867011 RepID=UPI0021A3E37D|nr:HNH endonuclease [Jannaschia sp. M317]UWQ16145.1 HNH endonuclease [Jannaschia sp. M317]